MATRQRRASRHEQGSCLPCCMRGFFLLRNKTRLYKKSWVGFLVLLLLIMCLSLTFRIDTQREAEILSGGVKRSITPTSKVLRFDSKTIVEEFDTFTYQRLGVDLAKAFPILKTPPDFWAENGEPIGCLRETTLLNTGSLSKMSLVFSLVNAMSQMEALAFVRQAFVYAFNPVVEEIIITAETGLPEEVREALEEAVDICEVCRLFLVDGNIYHHRNFAARFARARYIAFVDARIILTPNWLMPLVKCLQANPTTVMSPQLHLYNFTSHIHDVGFTRNELTWDLEVTRGPINVTTFQNFCVNQTVISKEVLAVDKDFFISLGGFDTLPNVTGGEHVSFSLKVLNCRGNVATSLCSHVFLRLQQQPEPTGNLDVLAVQTDFHSPTFQTTHNNVSVYHSVYGKFWQDSFSTKYVSCCRTKEINMSALVVPQAGKNAQLQWGQRGLYRPRHMPRSRTQYVNSEFSNFRNELKSRMQRMKCGSGNLRYIQAKRQAHLSSPSKFAISHGYIRTLDGMYALGLVSNTSWSSHQHKAFHNWGDIILTRNASLWVGPFSFTNGAFIYKHGLCLTVTPENTLTLSACAKGTVNQLFSYLKYVIRPAGVLDKCACATQSRDISSSISIAQCSTPGIVHEFKMEVEFTKDCVK